MKVLVTGAVGQIGGRLVEYLREQGDEVTTTDVKDLPLDYRSGHKTLDLLGCMDAEIAEVIGGAQGIVHLASLNEVDSVQRPLDAIEVNVAASKRLLDVAIAQGVKRFVYLSTAHVYGPLAGDITEKNLTRPLHPYAITHRAFESFLEAEQGMQTIEGIVLRLSNSFGPPGLGGDIQWSLVAHDLCLKAVRGEPLVLKAPQQVRDFITRRDVVRGIRHALAMDRALIGDGLFNLGGDAPMSILEMTQLIGERSFALLGRKPEIVAPEQESPKQNTLNFSSEKLKHTGFSLERNFAQEIDMLLKYCAETSDNG